MGASTIGTSILAGPGRSRRRMNWSRRFEPQPPVIPLLTKKSEEWDATFRIWNKLPCTKGDLDFCCTGWTVYVREAAGRSGTPQGPTSPMQVTFNRDIAP